MPPSNTLCSSPWKCFLGYAQSQKDTKRRTAKQNQFDPDWSRFEIYQICNPVSLYKIYK